MSDGYQDETIIPVDVDVLMRDEVLKAMPDGPVKRLMATLGVELDHDGDQPPPVLIVRRR